MTISGNDFDYVQVKQLHPKPHNHNVNDLFVLIDTVYTCAKCVEFEDIATQSL